MKLILIFLCCLIALAHTRRRGRRVLQAHNSLNQVAHYGNDIVPVYSNNYNYNYTQLLHPQHYPPPNTQLPQFSNKCGESLVLPTGAISYKPYQALEENERCVWTIRAENATAYKLRINFLGWDPLQTEETGLIVSCGRTNSLKHYPVYKPGKVKLDYCNLLIITFYSGQNAFYSTGFSLEYLSFVDDYSPRIAQTSVDIRFTEQMFHVKYPESGRFSADELTTFLFPTRNNTYSPVRLAKVVYIREDMKPKFCLASLRKYFFVMDAPPKKKWQYHGKICDDTQADLMIHDDMILVLFKSERDVEDNGFHFTYT